MQREEFFELKVKDTLIDHANIPWEVVFVHPSDSGVPVIEAALHHAVLGVVTLHNSDAALWKKKAEPFFEEGETYVYASHRAGAMEYAIERVGVTSGGHRWAVAQRGSSAGCLFESDFPHMRKVQK